MAEVETRSRTQIRIDAVRRLYLMYVQSGTRPHYIVSEFPKCGGTWVSQMLAAYLDVPFPRNEDVAFLGQPPSLLHGHHLYSKHYHNALYVLRDGRDVMVSDYYHSVFHNKKNVEWAVEEARNKLQFADYDDIKANLPKFIEYQFTEYLKGMLHFHFSWSQFVDSVMDNPTNNIRYEDLLEDTARTMAGAIQRMTGGEVDIPRLQEVCDRFSFQRQSKRKPGEEDTKSFLRKGIAGDWKNNFTREACEVFDRFAGDALIKAGYEKDRSWIEQGID